MLFRSFRIGKHPTRGMWIFAVAGMIGSFLTFIVGFIPPGDIHVGSVFRYEALIVGGLVSMIILPLLLYRKSTIDDIR